MKALLALCLVVTWVIPASAGVPDPAMSTIPCFVVCPQGDMPLVITVRDAFANPIANSTVVLQLCSIEGTVAFCEPPGPPCLRVGVTGPDGRVTFMLEAGGVSPQDQQVMISADGVILDFERIKSPDQNGDLVVDATDLAIARIQLGASDFGANLDCDFGPVDQDDLDVIRAHAGHFCEAPTPTRPGTWGQVKVRYR